MGMVAEFKDFQLKYMQLGMSIQISLISISSV